VETTIGSLIQDFRLAVQDVADHSKPSPNHSDQPPPPLPTVKQTTAKDRDSNIYGNESAKEKKERNWGKLLSRVAMLEEQWTQAQKQLRLQPQTSSSSQHTNTTTSSMNTRLKTGKESRIGSLLEERMFGCDTAFHSFSSPSPSVLRDTTSHLQHQQPGQGNEDRQEMHKAQQALVQLSQQLHHITAKEQCALHEFHCLQRTALNVTIMLATLSPAIFNIAMHGTTTHSQSSMTGLEELVALVHSGVGQQATTQGKGNAALNPAIQEACDRAVAESRALVRSYMILQRRHDQLVQKLVQSANAPPVISLQPTG